MENCLKFDSKPHLRDLRSIQETLDRLVEFRGYDRVRLDFRSIDAVFPDFMLALIALVYRYRTEGVRFDIIPPEDNKIQRLFVNCNWVHFMDPKAGAPVNIADGLNVSTVHFSTPEAQSKLVGQVIEKILKVVDHLDRAHLRALDWALYEITDNVLTHSKSEVGGFLQLSVHRKAKEIQFVVADAGVGIPASLRAGFNPSLTDVQALEAAIKEGVTSGEGQGNGLFGTFKVAFASRGGFSINSGAAYLALRRDGKVVANSQDGEIAGCVVDCSISYARPLLLEEALSFKGKPHTPQDILDLNYSHAEGEALQFCLSRETKSLGSRLAGRECRVKLNNLIRLVNPSEIHIEMIGCGIVSSSFADELFVKFLSEIVNLPQKPSIKILNATELQYNIIRRSGLQRGWKEEALRGYFYSHRQRSA